MHIAVGYSLQSRERYLCCLMSKVCESTTFCRRPMLIRIDNQNFNGLLYLCRQLVCLGRIEIYSFQVRHHSRIGGFDEGSDIGAEDELTSFNLNMLMTGIWSLQSLECLDLVGLGLSMSTPEPDFLFSSNSPISFFQPWNLSGQSTDEKNNAEQASEVKLNAY